jgi:hypothetical protein
MKQFTIKIKNNVKQETVSRLSNPLFHKHVINPVNFAGFNLEQVMGIGFLSDSTIDDFD